jgi:hypothetical protein
VTAWAARAFFPVLPQAKFVSIFQYTNYSQYFVLPFNDCAEASNEITPKRAGMKLCTVIMPSLIEKKGRQNHETFTTLVHVDSQILLLLLLLSRILV